jgi:hypothetical protein
MLISKESQEKKNGGSLGFKGFWEALKSFGQSANISMRKQEHFYISLKNYSLPKSGKKEIVGKNV